MRQTQGDWQHAFNHYSPLTPRQAEAKRQAIGAPTHVAGAPHVYDSSDALLGEMLREVLPATALRHGTPR